MFEYGYIHVDPVIGSFKSRLALDELHQANRMRARSGAEIIDKYPKWEGFREFIKDYPAARDPFLHEARVHIRSRDVNLISAHEAENASDAGRLFTFAFREHQILALYFGDLYAASSYRWSAEQEMQVKARIIDGLTRQSRVSQHLITTYTKKQALWFFGILVLVLLTAAHLAGRKVHST